MSIIDTLVQYGDEAAKFTVNTAVSYVNVVNPVPPGSNGVLSIGGVFNTFQWKDKINLLSFAVLLPLGFEFFPNDRTIEGDPWPNYVDFFWRRVADGGITTWVPSRYNLISENYEMSLGAYLEPPDIVISDFNLVALLPQSLNITTRISMINVPSSLNEFVFACPIFVKVEHTLPMV